MPSDDASRSQSTSTHLSHLFPHSLPLRTQQYLDFASSTSIYPRSKHRFALFHSNARHIRVHNNDISQSYTLGINKFADWTKHELKTLRGVKPRFNEAKKRVNKAKSVCQEEGLEALVKEAQETTLPAQESHAKTVRMDLCFLLLTPVDEMCFG